MGCWVKLRGNAIALAAVGAAGLIIGAATYKYLHKPQSTRTTRPGPNSQSSPKKRADRFSRRSKTKEAVVLTNGKDTQAPLLDVSRYFKSDARENTDNSQARQNLKFRENESEQVRSQQEMSSPLSSHHSSASSTKRSKASTAHSSIEAEEEDEFARFAEVLEAMEPEVVQDIALKVRLEQMPVTSKTSEATLHNTELTCEVENNPRCGTYNIVYPMVFSDGVQWLVRIPGHGHKFNCLDKIKMKSEYRTMRYIRTNTNMPLPEVHYWQTEAGKAGAAFALMEYLPGRPLCKVWKGSLNETTRLRVLRNIAKYTSQLQFVHFDKLGILNFHDDGSVHGLDGQISFVANAESETPWAGVTKSGRPYLTYQEKLYESWDDCSDLHKSSQADMAILRKAVESIPTELLPESTNPLDMADLDSQDILVDDNGNVTGLIDWDSSGPFPALLGCAAYPPWLMEDWGPWYDYDSKRWPEEQHDPSPQEMIRYRRFYSEVFADYSRDVPEYDARMTRLSHIVSAMVTAVSFRFGRSEIIVKILAHAFGANPPFDLRDYCKAFENDDTREYDEMLEEAFVNMWHAEWEVLNVADGRERVE